MLIAELGEEPWAAVELRSGRTVADPFRPSAAVAAIAGTLEPSRAVGFDSEFRPSPQLRRRWLSVWMAEQYGAVLPPISVAPLGDGYAIRDGHHRVSVAQARGAVAISAVVA